MKVEEIEDMTETEFMNNDIRKYRIEVALFRK